MQGRQIIYLAVFIVIGFFLVSGVFTLIKPAPQKKVDPHGPTAKEKDAVKDDHKADQTENDVMAWVNDNGIWAVAVFIGLLIVLRQMAWKPWKSMASEREGRIRQDLEEAKLARAETARMHAEFENKMQKALAEIPKMKKEAEEDGANLRKELVTRAHKEIEEEKQRLHREIETAKDQALAEIWNQTAQLATLISAKTVSNNLNADDHRRLTEEALNDVDKAGEQWQSDKIGGW